MEQAAEGRENERNPEIVESRQTSSDSKDRPMPVKSSSFSRPRLSLPDGLEVDRMREQFLQQKPGFCFSRRQQAARVEIFLLFEEPTSSRAARYFSVGIFVCIILSIAQFMLETMPELNAVSDEVWLGFEGLFTMVFMVEYLTRLFVCDVCGMSPWAFIRTPMNMVDLVAIFPFFVFIFLQPILAAIGGPRGSGVSAVAGFIRAVRLVRLFRIFKLARYSTGLKMMMVALGNSGQALNVLVFFLGIGCVLFSSMVYHMENLYCPDQNTFNDTQLMVYQQECSDKLKRLSQYGLCCNEKNVSLEFPSILSGFYWTIVTMSTVGYGDVVPQTPAGRLAGAVTMCSGILLFALPIALIGARFQEAYNTAVSRGSPSLQVRKRTKDRDDPPLKVMSTRLRLLRFSNTSSTRLAKELSKELEEASDMQEDIRMFERAEKELQKRILRHGSVVVKRLQHHVDVAKRQTMPAQPESGSPREPDDSEPQMPLGPLLNQPDDVDEPEVPPRMPKMVSFDLEPRQGG